MEAWKIFSTTLIFGIVQTVSINSFCKFVITFGGEFVTRTMQVVQCLDIVTTVTAIVTVTLLNIRAINELLEGQVVWHCTLFASNEFHC